MIKTVSEIVNAALDLSQLEGSNMLTYSRMIYLLNSAYGRLYNYVTDQTEDWGSLQCVVRHRSEMPHNLLKVRGVYEWNGIREGDELERVDHEPEPGQYWIHGEVIHCGGRPGDMYILRYYPKPATITFPCKPEPTEYERIYDNYLGAVEGNDIRVVNLRNGEELYHPVVGPIKDWVLVHGVPVYLTETGELHKGNAVVTGVVELFQDKWGEFAYGYTLENDERDSVSWDGVSYIHEGLWFHILWGAKYRFEAGRIYRADRHYPEEWDDVTETLVPPDHVANNVIFSDLYMAIDIRSNDGLTQGIKIVDENHGSYFVRPMLRQGNVPGVRLIDFDHNDENGYGVIYSVRGQKEIAGFCPDTVLDYPKTIYFDWLEAELAKLFLVEARQDVGTVDALSAQYWTRLMEDAERQVGYAYKLKNRRGGIYKRRY